MGFEQIDEACKAGVRAENTDFATPSGIAGINPLKIAKRNLYIPFHATSVSGSSDGSAAGGSLTYTQSGSFPIAVFHNATADTLYTIARPRGEISPGEKGTLKIMWRSTGTTGTVRFVADIKPAIQNTANLSSAVQRAVIAAPNSVGSSFTISKMEFPPSVFNNNQLWGLKLARDPANSLDTLASDVDVCAIWMEILGRC